MYAGCLDITMFRKVCFEKLCDFRLLKVVVQNVVDHTQNEIEFPDEFECSFAVV